MIGTYLQSKEIRSAKYFVIMPFVEIVSLKDIKFEWVERRVDFRGVYDMPIRFVSVATLCDAESDNSNSFSLSRNLFSTPEVNITKIVNKSGKEVIKRNTKSKYKSSK